MSIKAIETEYKGYRFRSRLEARWAVFFDALGLKWDYEPEGFDLTDACLTWMAELEREILNDGADYCRSRLADLQSLVKNKKALWYLPDFYLRDLGEWVEIKPYQGMGPWSNDIRHSLFPGYLLVVCGIPGAVDIHSDDWSYSACYQVWDCGDTSFLLCECAICGALGFQYMGRADRNNHAPGCTVIRPHQDRGNNSDSPRIRHAAKIATSARFEHGEKPKVRS